MKKIIALVALAMLTGCETTPATTYYWGNYESLVYNMYKNPGEATADQQVEKLRKDIEAAASKGKPVPPGLFAHIGMLYASMGDAPQAKESLNQELALYPESAVFVDGLISRMEQER